MNVKNDINIMLSITIIIIKLYHTDLSSSGFGYKPYKDHSVIRRFPNRRFAGYARGHGIRGIGAQFA